MFFFFSFTGSNLQLSRKSTRSLTPLFANPMAATLESPYLAPYTVPLDLRYCFVASILLKIIVIQLNVHSAYRVILRY